MTQKLILCGKNTKISNSELEGDAPESHSECEIVSGLLERIYFSF